MKKRIVTMLVLLFIAMVATGTLAALEQTLDPDYVSFDWMLFITTPIGFITLALYGVAMLMIAIYIKITHNKEAHEIEKTKAKAELRTLGKKPEKKPVDETAFTSRMTTIADVHIIVKYIYGLPNFSSDWITKLKLNSDELHISSNDRSASLSYSKITFADCINTDKDNISSSIPEAAKILLGTHLKAGIYMARAYFLIKYLGENGEEQALIFTPPHDGDYSLFMHHLEKRLPTTLPSKLEHLKL